MKNILFPVGLVIALLFISCNKEQSAAKTQQANPVAVNLFTLKKAQENQPYIMVSGTVAADNAAQISTRHMGYVKAVYAKLGDKVKKGQSLINISNTELSAQLAQVKAKQTEARAAFLNAQKDYERYTQLFKQNSATQKELDDMQTQYSMAQARLKAAQEMQNEIESQFAYTQIKAPFTGTITSKNVQVGDLAKPGQVLMQLEGDQSLLVETRIPESDINRINQQDSVAVYLSSIDQRLKAEVFELSNSARFTGGQYTLKVRLINPPASVKAGMYAQVKLPIELKKDHELQAAPLLIPKEALVKQGQLTGVFTPSLQNTAVLRWLRLGQDFGDQVEVLSGLSPEEQIIINSQGRLQNGTPIVKK
ncbi:efflux RND transporter periplasmic adaptor subunit [Mesonia sediminis]|uniref:Efflux RND transporter periplasmic adaptor subunit n=1 Tax=Mesonia sediminis TaxID=1703946 RepID=A0ABW5SDL9_9FLAO